MDITGKIALVTGGASGIGAATCEAFAKAGGHVIVADINVDGGEKIALPAFPQQLFKRLDDWLRMSLMEWSDLWEEFEQFGRKLMEGEFGDYPMTNDEIEDFDR